jgi:DMSO/TMAO reductase YedYZ molybdopterin-dependent catalytic subunit
MNKTSRRQLLAGAAVTTGAALLAKQYDLIPPDAASLYGCGHTLTYAAQRLLIGNANAREFPPSQISAINHPKDTFPKGDAFQRLKANGFADWKLQIDGLVTTPQTLTIAQLKTYPASSQITQLICEEGWSYIAQWAGVPLSHILQLAGAKPAARFVVYSAMDEWVDAIDMADALHPQTIVTHTMNNAPLPIGHGGPLRLRVPRQLGYKSLKFLNKLTLTDSLKGVAGEGSYSWYAGI